ncbi:unnamed protein product [Cunninghamella echinulata]
MVNFISIPPLLAACEGASKPFLFSNCTERVFDDPDCLCNSTPWLGSMVTCIDQYSFHNTHEQNDAWALVTTYCPDLSSLANQISFQDLLNNATNYLISVPSDKKNPIIYNPTRFNSSVVLPIKRTTFEFNKQLEYGLIYGGAGVAFVFGVMLLGMLNNFYHYYYSLPQGSLISNSNKKKIMKNKPKAIPPSPSWIQSFRRHLINPSLLLDGVHLEHASWFGILVTYPTRLESIFVFLYVALNIILLFPSYDLFMENTYWSGDLGLQLIRYIADRSGEMSFAQLPLVYLFSGRNNIMIWLTGWSYDRFMVAHKWTSRVMFLHAVIHSITYTCYPVRIGGWATYITYYQEAYFIWGVVATVLGGFIILFAMPQLRRAFYDIFLYTHIVLVVIFTVGCWYHVYLIEDHENMPWLYACFAIWAYDRIVRLVRVIYYNVLLATTGNKILRKVRADIIPGTDCVRLTVDANKAGLSQRVPGVFVYIYVPSIYFWQSHPFTIASWDQPSIDLPSPQSALKSIYDKTVNTDVSSSIIEKKSKENDHSTSTSSSSISSDQQGNTSISSTATNNNATTFELLIRPQQGMTKKLYEKVEKEGRDGCDMYVVIEGPYGHTHPVLQYDTAILIAGGVGTTATVPYLQEAVYNASNMAVRHLVFIWVVQYEDQLKWSQDAIEKCISHLNQQQQKVNNTNGNDITDIQSEKSILALDVSIYVTRSKAPVDKDSKDKLQGASLSYGVRPDLNKQVGKYIDMASGSSVAVLQCGPVRMSDQIRQITADHGIPYFEEAFNW